MKYVIIKVDTTGLDPENSDIVKISALKISDDKTELFDTFINPGVQIPAAASRISGICDMDIEDAPTFEMMKKPFLDFIGNLPIIGHNIDFDLKFINKYLDTPLQNRKMSLMDMARGFGYAGSLKFSNMCSHYGISQDCSVVEKTNLLFNCMVKDYQKRKDNLDA